MFTRDQLLKILPASLEQSLPPVESIQFTQVDFAPSDGEEMLFLGRGLKTRFEGGLLFWIAFLQCENLEGRQEYFLPYAKRAHCAPITKMQFDNLLSPCIYDLIKPMPLFFHNIDDCSRGLLMYDDWNNIAALLEIEEAYLAFNWNTTA